VTVRSIKNAPPGLSRREVELLATWERSRKRAVTLLCRTSGEPWATFAKASRCRTTISWISTTPAGSRRWTGWPSRTWTSIDVGHYSPATKADEAALRAYLVDLHQQVLDLARSGESWDQLYRNVKFTDEVKHWTAFDVMHTLNILGMYRWVANHRRGEW
jgi:hypothetical protein